MLASNPSFRSPVQYRGPGIGSAEPWRVALYVLLAALLTACAGGANYRSRAVLETLETDADPCADFYQYACGGWLDRVSLPPDQSLWRRAFSAIQRNNLRGIESLIVEAQGQRVDSDERLIADFFETCLDDGAAERAGLEPLRPYLERSGDIGDARDALELAGVLRQTVAAPLIASAVWPDYGEPGRNILHLAQSGLGMGSADLYLDGDEERLEAYRQYVENLLVHLGAQAMNGDPAGNSERIVRFESRLAALWIPLAIQRDPRHAYNPVEPAEWAGGRYRAPLEAYARGLGVAPPARLNLTGPDYFVALVDLLEDTEPETLRRYFRWRIIDAHRSLLGPRARRIAFAFYGQHLQGVRSPALRRHQCIVLTQQALGEPLGKLFVEQRFSPAQRDAARNLVAGLRDTLVAQVGSAEWRAPEDRERARRKAQHMGLKVGYPEGWRDYTGLRLDGGSVLADSLAVRAFENADQLARLGQPVDPQRWAVDVFKVNAYYNASANEVVFPAGILMPPLFDPEAPAAVNYGAIGSMIAHEMSHGFDANGSHFAADGRIHSGWLANTEQAFAAHKQCVAEHFRQRAGGGHDDTLTLAENMADLAGLRLAWEAFQRQAPEPLGPFAATGLGPEQLFFVSFAQSWCSVERAESADLSRRVDPHAGVRARVNGAVAGVPGFAEAFACPARAPMNPDQRCELP